MAVSLGQSVENLVRSGLFTAEELAELEKLDFEEEDFVARLASRREQVGQLAQLKTRIIEALNTAEALVTKGDLKIRGVGGDIVKADEEGITAQLRTKTETRAWNDLGEQSTEPLLGLLIDRQKPEDLLAAALLAMACKDTTLAEGCFDRARQLGVDTGPYLAPLAQTAFARARELMDEGQFSEADEMLANIEAKYADIPWFAINRKSLAAAQSEAKQGIYEAEAERLYAEAARLFQKEQFFDVKSLVEKLKAEYANSEPVTDAAREPSFAEMEQGVADIGQFITVRQDGKGDFTSIQAAIDAAPPNSLIEIQDNGPYNEKVEIREDGTTIRGKNGRWPIITSVGPLTIMFSARPRTKLERLILAHRGAVGDASRCIVGGPLTMRSCVLFGGSSVLAARRAELEYCVIIGGTDYTTALVVRNSLWVSGGPRTDVLPCTYDNVLLRSVGRAPQPRSEMSHCTILQQVHVKHEGVVLVDCIMPSVGTTRSDLVMEHCNVYGNVPLIDLAKAGKGCFGGDPQFIDPKVFNYRLMPTSPCRGRASDGGDLGCRLPDPLQRG